MNFGVLKKKVGKQAVVRRHEQMEKKWARQSQARESRDKKARKCVSKQGRLETVKEFLSKEMKYTANQVDLLTSDKKIRPKEWPLDEMLESLYQYDLGRELYGYLHKHLADKIPMPSVTALLRYKHSNPETFICTVRECKKTLYSQVLPKQIHSVFFIRNFQKLQPHQIS